MPDRNICSIRISNDFVIHININFQVFVFISGNKHLFLIFLFLKNKKRNGISPGEKKKTPNNTPFPIRLFLCAVKIFCLRFYLLFILISLSDSLGTFLLNLSSGRTKSGSHQPLNAFSISCDSFCLRFSYSLRK